ncbi:hypothetical protein GGX14DRAFT_392346 [Mycena pura]|uniref:Uncharacterized protein n=1 Tax=Mycena pura TaxID=153505 RepID=A0AAD6YHM7_9AGAR|nr:hypothetical protein GGX14DRAFT_392346 [Mycena pura]
MGATALGKLERERKEMTERQEHGTGAAEGRKRGRGGGEGYASDYAFGRVVLVRVVVGGICLGNPDVPVIRATVNAPDVQDQTRSVGPQRTCYLNVWVTETGGEWGGDGRRDGHVIMENKVHPKSKMLAKDLRCICIAIHNRAENYGSYRAWSYCSCRYLSSLARTAGNQELPRSDSGQPGAIISYQTTGISYPVSWDPKRKYTHGVSCTAHLGTSLPVAEPSISDSWQPSVRVSWRPAVSTLAVYLAKIGFQGPWVSLLLWKRARDRP